MVGLAGRQRALSATALGWTEAKALVVEAVTGEERVVLGICGAPGAGKSTLAQALLAVAQKAAPGRSVLVGMDGWHLAHDVIVGNRTVDRKGAPDTFDGAGYVDSLRRIRRQRPDDGPIWLPEFRRDIENAVAGAIAVRADHRLVLTEGNYLLLDTAPWVDVRTLLDVCWTIDVPEDVRLARLAERHRRFGRPADEADRRARVVDQANADLVDASVGRADASVSLDGMPAPVH